MSVPVVFLIFNRPDTTKIVFEAIRQAKPAQLFVIADGPRPDRPDDLKNCTETRSIINQVDWDCQVLTDYSEDNLGCKKRVSSGLNWVFSLVEEAIVLEDDCLPHPSFFKFCEEMLEKYEDDSEIMAISGSNFLEDWHSSSRSYHFSYFFYCWGWATWKRAWDLYDDQMVEWHKPEVKNRIKALVDNEQRFEMVQNSFNIASSGNDSSWARRLFFAYLSHSGKILIPAVNVISNIGFGSDATHTNCSADHIMSNVPRSSISFPLNHPPNTDVDREYMVQEYELLFSRSLKNKIRRKVKNYGRKFKNQYFNRFINKFI